MQCSHASAAALPAIAAAPADVWEQQRSADGRRIDVASHKRAACPGPRCQRRNPFQRERGPFHIHRHAVTTSIWRLCNLTTPAPPTSTIKNSHRETHHTIQRTRKETRQKKVNAMAQQQQQQHPRISLIIPPQTQPPSSPAAPAQASSLPGRRFVPATAFRREDAPPPSLLPHPAQPLATMNLRSSSLTQSGTHIGMTTSYPRVHVDFGIWLTREENRTAGALLLEALKLRAKYLAALEQPPPPPIVMQGGPTVASAARGRSSSFGSASADAATAPVGAQPRVATPQQSSSLMPASTSVWTCITPVPSPPPLASRSPSPNKEEEEGVPSPSEFVADYDRILEICATGPVVSYALKRLRALEHSFEIHRLLNSRREVNATKYTPMDSASIVRVDTHVHLAAAMSEKHLLEFIKKKLETSPDEVVLVKDGKEMTLRQVFESLGLDESRLSVHALDTRAGRITFQRFDQFNSRFDPFGISDLRKIFLKVNNHIKGKYLAELCHELFGSEEERSKKTEYRISVYGRSPVEWDELAQWVKQFQVHSVNNRWLIQVPRIYPVLRHTGAVSNFKQMLDNIFAPLFAVSENPSSNPDLDSFLQNVSGFDSVDDESRVDLRLEKSLPDPETWDNDQNPPYMYYMYYMFRNIALINQLRRARGLGTFDFRPHCGESGSERHLAAAFLTATGISHGINLEKLPVLEYLFYLAKIGVCVSPLSNNSLFLNYASNPFDLFFRRGLNVSLSSDDPLQFHYTQSPLMEEYAIAARFWKLTEVDLAEIARSSVLHSGFPNELKAKWLGPQFALPGISGNDPFRTNVPMIRAHYRNHMFEEEVKMMLLLAPGKARSPPPQQQSPSMVAPSLSPTASSSSSSSNSSSYATITISGSVLFRNDEANEEYFQALPLVLEALALRDKYQVPQRAPLDGASVQNSFAMRDGVILWYENEAVLCSNDRTELATVFCEVCKTEHCALCDDVLHRAPAKRTHRRVVHEPAKPKFEPIRFEEFVQDYERLCTICNDGPCRSVCWRRLHLLEERFHFHLLIHEDLEEEAVKSSGMDFYRAVKVDTHVHINRSMTSAQLLQFIKKKLFTERDVVVRREFHGKKDVKLGELFEMLGVRDRNLNLDALNVRAGQDTFQRFDSWVSKYTPFSKPELRELFLKTYNEMNGRYLAELLHETTFRQLTLTPSLRTELRISVSGSTHSEFGNLAHWVLSNKLRHPGNRWLIQVPRIYPLLFADKRVSSFGQLLENIFCPLFEATRNPELHQELADFLLDVSGFDTVGDENQLEGSLSLTMPRPHDWKTGEQPPYAYWLYFLYANIESLNSFRHARGLNTFSFRPHTGESGEMFHLAAGYLVAKHINHGTQLMKHPVPQYLYYLSQIGLAVSPLSESSVHLDLSEDPFYVFFKRGLNVSLSTDNPLQLHITSEPLVEEYALAAQMWKLSVADMCEIARNSVLQSGFTDEERERWIGRFWTHPVDGNDIGRTAVPSIRLRFRRDTFLDELAFVRQSERSSSEMSSLLCMV